MQLFLSILLITSSLFACNYPETITVGEISPCDGQIVPTRDFINLVDIKRQVKLKDLKISELEGISDAKDKQIRLYKVNEELNEDRHNIYRKELNKKNTELTKLQIKSSIGYVLSFTFGALLTGYIVREVRD